MKDSETKLQEIKEMLRTFAKEREWGEYHTPKDLSIAIATEAAEIMDHFRFRNGKDLEEYLASPRNMKDISHEIADVFSFLVRLADELNVDLAAAVKEKMEINEKRYPVETSIRSGWMRIKQMENEKEKSEQNVR